MGEMFGSYSTHKEQPKAFPATGPVANQGMNLRDWFAGMALQGLLASGATYGGKTDNRIALAGDAYATADAMMAARNNEQK